MTATAPIGDPAAMPAGRHHRFRLGLRVGVGDGVELNTDVVLPDGPGPFPAVLIRTPYGTGTMMKEAMGWAAQGLAAVVQDVRGRYESGGRWRPWVGERADGTATLRWLRRQPWSDGRVITYGSSYGAHCALEIALAAGSRLTGVIAAVPALSHAQTIREPSGVPRLLAHAWWWPSHGQRRVPHGPVIDALHLLEPGILRALPVAELPRCWGGEDTGWRRAWDAERPPVPTGAPGSPPLLVVGGRYDAYADTAVELFTGWRGPRAHLVLGPWGHDLGLSRRDTGVRSGRPGVRPGMLVRGWVGDLLGGGRAGVRRRWLAAVDGGPGDEGGWWAGTRWPAITDTVFDTGTDTVFDTGAGTVIDTGTGTVFDTASAPVTTVGGPDSCSDVPPELRREFIADPDDPFPAQVASDDVTATLDRPDQARFEWPPDAADRTLIGRPEVTLTGLGRTGPEAGPVPLDWVVRLLRITPDGRAIQLAHAAVRTAAAGAEVVLPPLADVVPAGHRLAVQVTGHLFPLFPRDPQDGSDPLTATRLHAVTRRVGGVELQLPVVSAEGPIAHPVRADRLPGAWL